MFSTKEINLHEALERVFPNSAIFNQGSINLTQKLINADVVSKSYL